MSNSSRHKKLISRIRSIEGNLLPAIKISGNYTKKESDLIRSYVLLVHAEIESFFEDVAENKAQKTLDNWKLTRKKSNCLLSIMAFCSNDINWDNCNDKNKIESRVNRTVTHYLNSLKSNHGVKTKNLLKILLPVGIEVDDIDQAWLNTMENFGTKRGIIAHSTISTQTQIDLVSERNNINSILPEIENIDELVKNIK